MTEFQLTDLLATSETRLVERKVSMPNAAEVRKTLVAFANTVSENEFAVMFIGVGDKGNIQGVQNADGVQREVRRIGENDCYPPVICEPRVMRVAGVEIIAVIIPPSTNRPHFSGQAYIRRGSESVKASEKLFEEMIASRNDKARKILTYKGKLISARFTGTEGAESRAFVPREWRDYRVEECDGHYVQFKDTQTGVIYTPSLEHVALEFDVIQHRIRLFVKEAGQ